ncbi:DUF2267 domain-containing protein [Nannocystis sp. SCPEA4]|uniref:DUF2267 domain-containing protein n=1 Tax=Nannocystis sp. SCPEA4 TaxID=2996787 RepID=UPI00226DB146|nr:DUF2267 domain-containing protein [Nannocystis sp. SCPEA4]MCY1059676.1 DUF2267 domain-containing protein [Nannocystis sp. SCPEA4]
MSSDRFTLFQETLQTSSKWIREITAALPSADEQQAYHLLCATLRTLRDRLRPDDAIHLAAQLPVLIRGLYYDGWRLSDVPMRIRSRKEFIAHVATRYHARPIEDLEPGVRAVLATLSRNVDLDETTSILRTLPEELRELWPAHLVEAA